jgi:hypothetical protein
MDAAEPADIAINCNVVRRIGEHEFGGETEFEAPRERHLRLHVVLVSTGETEARDWKVRPIQGRSDALTAVGIAPHRPLANHLQIKQNIVERDAAECAAPEAVFASRCRLVGKGAISWKQTTSSSWGSV